jgi:hypothetical protein
MSPETKAAQVNLRISPALKAAAEKAAEGDQRSLTSLIEKLLTDHLQAQPTLESWHDRARGRFLRLIAEHKIELAAELGLVARSYRIKTTRGENVAPHQLQEKLRLVSGDLDRMFSYVNLFYPYTRAELLPYFTSDSDLKRGALDEVLECFAYPPLVSELEFWRVSPTGIATDVRPLFEDRTEFSQHGLRPGTWFSPFFLARDLAVMLFHAHHFAKCFPEAKEVEFRCEWSGLQERAANDPDPMRRWIPGKVSRAGHRVTAGEWPVSDIRSAWPEMISALAGPVVRLFDPAFSCSPDWIREQAVRFK